MNREKTKFARAQIRGIVVGGEIRETGGVTSGRLYEPPYRVGCYPKRKEEPWRVLSREQCLMILSLEVSDSYVVR